MNLSVIIFPTLFSSKKQTILAFDNIEIYINPKGAITTRIGDEEISIKQTLSLRTWYKINVKISIKGKVIISQKNLKNKRKRGKNEIKILVKRSSLEKYL